MRRSLFIVLFFWCTVNVQAALFYFDRISTNADTDIASQFRLDVSQVGADAAFTFYNDGPVDSSISEIYFYDGSLLQMYSIDDSCEGVDFEDLGEATDPAELPGYAPLANLLVVLSATEAQTPEPQNGVNPGQWLTINYLLAAGKTFQDLLDGLTSGQTVVGIHVKSIEPEGGDFSDSFITPEPATLVLLCTGSVVLLKRRRR